MAILVDPARWHFRGRLWAHLVSDTTLIELHAFAFRLELPARAFDTDHYDIPAGLRVQALEFGALAVPSSELMRRLRAAGLRRRKRGTRRRCEDAGNLFGVGIDRETDTLRSPAGCAAPRDTS